LSGKEVTLMTAVIRLPLPRSPSRFEPDPDTLALLRRAPVQRAELPDGTGGWLVTGYAEVREVLTGPQFSRALAVKRARRGPEVAAAGSLLGMDPPEHTRLRRLVAGAFTQRRAGQLQPRVAAIVSGLLDEFAAKGRPGDLVSGFSLPLPVQVICELLGVPAADVGEFHAWSTAGIGDWERDHDEMMAAWTAMGTYIAGLIEAKRARPADDLITALIAARDGEDRLSELELIQLCVALLVGGHETTASHINMSLLALLAHPVELARLRADPGLIPGAVEELLRYVLIGGGAPPPARIATEDVALGGAAIAAGDMVWPLAGTANRDPAVFADPDRLDVGRAPGTHMAFGAGAHHCLGAQLARVELREAFRGLLTRLPGLRLAVPTGELRYKEGTVLNSLHELPVTWDDE
jgi:cytochrome P450